MIFIPPPANGRGETGLLFEVVGAFAMAVQIETVEFGLLIHPHTDHQ